MPRSLKKGPYIDENLMEKIKNSKKGEVIKTWSRESVVTPDMIGHIIGVYNGKKFVEVNIREDMVGHKLGEFSPTTKFNKHGGKIQRRLEKGEERRE
ncbi:MAG: 30S ribosomal protein S19 [Minisyncoccales bacterium]